MRFADSRPDFHRHSKELEDAVDACVKKALPTIDQSLAQRKALSILQSEVMNLFFCAETSGIVPTQKRLANLSARITDSLEKIEERLSSAAKTKPATGFSSLVEKTLSASSTKSGMTLIETVDGHKPVHYVHFLDVFAARPCYAVWSTQDRKVATGFVLYPHALTAWSRRCLSNNDIAHTVLAKAAEDRIITSKLRLVNA